MASDTLMVYVDVYDRVADAEADYQFTKDLHTDADLIDAYDAAVIERRDGGKTKIVKKHETRRGSAASSVAGSDWRRGSSWPCSRSPRSAVACWPLRRAVAPCSARSRVMPWPA